MKKLQDNLEATKVPKSLVLKADIWCSQASQTKEFENKAKKVKEDLQQTHDKAMDALKRELETLQQREKDGINQSISERKKQGDAH